ncbi:MAG: CoA transferase [Chloroflexi bacterium]|nr:CoA transferase [Chloroflexota bacterium]
MLAPLKGIRVLDLTDSIVGPFTTRLLTGCGAEVIRVESRLHLGFRRNGPWGPAGNGPIPQAPEKLIDFSKVDTKLLVSPTFGQYNHDKLSVALNLSKPEGRGLFKRLVRVSDVVVDNFRFGVMQKWGFVYAGLKELKDDLIVVSLQSLGKGPSQDWATWGMNLLSFTGFAYGWGHPDTPVTERTAGGFHVDYIAGAETAVAIMAALIHRANTGEGQYIDVSQAEAGACVLGPSFLDYFINKRVAEPRGNRHPQFAPHNCYPCQGEDNWCVIAIFNETEWQQFCHALDDPSWTKDAKFQDMQSRLKNVDELDQNIERWTKQRTPHQVMKILQSLGVAAGAVQNGEYLYYDLQLRARNFMMEQQVPRLGKVTSPGMPVRFSLEAETESRRAPVLGEHNDYVYRQLLGLSPEEMDKLTDSKVIF